MTVTARPGARILALGAIHILGYVVAACSIVVGITYGVVAATGGFAFSEGRGFVRFAPPIALLDAAGFLVGSLTVAGIAFVVGDLAWRIRRGVTFAPSVSRCAWLLAVILGVGSWLSQIASTIAAQSGLIYPDDVDPDAVNIQNLSVHWQVGPGSFLPDLPLLGLAVVLGVLAYVVQSGERVQRETEGLI
jgi:hypothetical protein